MSKRKVIEFKKGWSEKAQGGIPFSLVQEKRRPSLAQLGELLTVREAAQYMKCTERAVYQWIYDGKLKKNNAGRSIRISTAALEEFLCA